VDDLLARLEQRIGLTRADLLGLAVALLGCVAATVVALGVRLPDAAPPPAAVGSDAPAPAEPVGAAVLVHVAGAVHRPGVVELVTGDRVADALDAAGGLLSTASVAALNLARPLVDGEQLLVPTVDEIAAGAGAAPAADDPALPDGRLDLNRASAADLEELPGVGPVLAARIVAHRTEQGPFTAAAELRAVSGIGEATWAALRDLVGVR
jgi:competence protein ComEA